MSDALNKAMRDAVVAGRLMRARQNYFVRMGRKAIGRGEALAAEAEFDRLSLEAITIEQREQEAGQ